MEEFAHPKEKQVSFFSSSEDVLDKLEDADNEYWENLKVSDIFNDNIPIHSYIEQCFITNNSNKFSCFKQIPSIHDQDSVFDNIEQLLQYIFQLNNNMDNIISSYNFKEFKYLIEKRYYVLQQKYLSLERSCLRRKKLNQPHSETISNPSLELCLNLISPMLSAYNSIPLSVSFECILALIKHGEHTNISSLITLLHTNSHPSQYPSHFISTIRDWIETILLHSTSLPTLNKQDNTTTNNKIDIIEKAILSLLEFGLVTTSVSCLLKASEHLLYNPEYIFNDKKGIITVLQRLYTIALSEPQCFHHLNHFPMTIPDRKKYQKISLSNSKELYCIVIDYTIELNDNITSNLIYLYEDGSIILNDIEIYKIDISNTILENDNNNNSIRHIACINGIIMWYNNKYNRIDCYKHSTKSSFSLNINWPEEKGSRDIIGIFSEGEYIYCISGQSNPKVDSNDNDENDTIIDNNNNNNYNDNDNNEKDSRLNRSTSDLSEKDKLLDNQISETQRLISSTEVIIFKFDINFNDLECLCVCITVLDHPFGSWTYNSYFLSDGKWLIISSIKLKETYNFLYAEFTTINDDNISNSSKKNIIRVRSMQQWGTDTDWFTVTGPNIWDTKNKRYWEYNIKEKQLSWVSIKCITPKFLRASEHLSAQSLINNIKPPKEIFNISDDNNNNNNNYDISNELVSICIISALDHIIQIRQEGPYTTERSKSVFTALLNILNYFSYKFLNNYSCIIYNSKEYWIMVTGLIGCLRIIKIQIGYCLNEIVAIEVGLHPNNNDKSCIGIKIREILFKLIQKTSTMNLNNMKDDKFILFIKNLSTDILFGYVEILYHPDELGDLLQSMVTRNPNEPEYLTFLSLLKQMSFVSDSSLLILSNTTSNNNQYKQVKLSILNCLFQILGEEFIIALNGQNITFPILEAAGTLLTTIQGSLTLKAWRESKNNFTINSCIEKGSNIWIYCSYGDTLLSYIQNLLNGIDLTLISYDNFIYSINNNPLFTELLPSYIHSFWLSNLDKNLLQVFYNQSGMFIDLLKSINNININLKDIISYEYNNIPFSKFKKEFYVLESKHPYMTEESKEDLYLVDTVIHPGALFLRLRFDKRSHKHKYDEIKFYKDNQFAERARLLMNGKVYYGIIDEINETFPEHDIICIGDTLILCFECYSYKSQYWGFRLEVTAYYTSDIKLFSYYPLLEIERVIGIIFSTIISELFNPPYVSDDYLNMEKIYRKYFDEPNSILSNGTTFNKEYYIKYDYDNIFNDILPGRTSEQKQFIHSILYLESQNAIEFIDKLKSLSHKQLSWTERYKGLFDPLTRTIFLCLLHHTNNIDNAILFNNTNNILIYLWEQSQNIQQWAKHYHQQHIDIPFESICRNLCLKANFLLTVYISNNTNQTEKHTCNNIINSVLSFIKMEELSLDGIIEIIIHKTYKFESRLIALELLQQLLFISQFPSVKYCILSQFSFPSPNITSGLEGCNPIQINQVLNIYSTILQTLCNIFSSPIHTKTHNTYLLSVLSLYHCSCVLSPSLDNIFISIDIFNYLKNIIIESSEYINKYSVLLLDERSKFIHWQYNQDLQLIDDIPINILIQKQKSCINLYSIAIRIFFILSIQYYNSDLENNNQQSIMNILIDILIKTKEYELPQSDIYSIDSYPVCDLTSEQIELYEILNEQVQEQSSDMLCFDILLFLLSLLKWNTNIINSISSKNIIQILLELLFNSTPRVQILAIKILSILIININENDLNIILKSTNLISYISNSSELFIFLYSCIGYVISKDILYNNKEKDLIIGKKRSLSPLRQLSNESPLKKQKISLTQDKSINNNTINNNNNNILLDKFLYNRTKEEQLTVIQELCSLFRCLLINNIWKNNIELLINKSLNNINILLKQIDNSKYIQIKDIYENIISGLSIIGGYEDIIKNHDYVLYIPKNKKSKNISKDSEKVFLYDTIGLKSYILKSKQHKIVYNEDLKSIPTLSYNSNMFILSNNNMIDILKIINYSINNSNIKLFLLEISQKVIHNNIIQFMKDKLILIELSNILLNLSLSDNIIVNPNESLETLKSKRLFYKYKLQYYSQYISNIHYSKDNNIPHYYPLLKHQFEKQFPYSIFHSININHIGKELQIHPLPFSTSEYSLILPCGMKIAGGSKITNTIYNKSTILTLTVVTHANFAIPRYPVLISFYFEVEIKKIATGGDIGIGLLDETCDVDHMDGAQIGTVQSSFAYISNGWVLAESTEPDEKHILESYTEGDIVGCILKYTPDGGDYLLSFTKNGIFQNINGEEDGYMHLPNLKLKFIPIIGLRGNGTCVEVNFGQKPYKYNISNILKQNRENINNTQISLPSPILVPHSIDPLSSDDDDSDEEISDLSSTSNNTNEILSPRQQNNISRYFEEESRFLFSNNSTILPKITSNKELFVFESSSSERILHLKQGDSVLLRTNSFSNSNGFIQKSAEILSIDFVSQFIQVIQRKTNLGCIRSFWIRLNDISKLLPDYTPSYNKLYEEINILNYKIIKLESREILLKLLSNNLLYYIYSYKPKLYKILSYNNNNTNNIINNISLLSLLSSFNLLDYLFKEKSTIFINFLKICCSSYIQHSILHENDKISFGYPYLKLPKPNYCMNIFLNIFKEYLLISSNTLKNEQLNILSILFNELNNNNIFNNISNIEESILKHNITNEQKITINNTTCMCIIPNPENLDIENIVIYLDNDKTLFHHQYSYYHRDSIRPIYIPEQSCIIINHSNRIQDSFSCTIYPKGDLYTNDINTLNNFNFQFFNCFISLFCDIYHTYNKDIICNFLQNIDLSYLIQFLEMNNCIIKPYISLLLTRLIRTLVLCNNNSSSFFISKLQSLSKICGKYILNQQLTPISSSMFELQMSILYAESQQSSIILPPVQIGKTVLDWDNDTILTEDNSNSDIKLSDIIVNLINNEVDSIEKQNIEKYTSIMDVIPIISGLKDPSDDIMNKLQALHYISTYTYESDHPCKYSHRERVYIPGASQLSIQFDHRCKLDYGDKLTFSIHNRRGADDLGHYPMRNWSNINVPGDSFYYELQLDKNNTDYERYEYGYRFTVIPYYNKDGILNILKNNAKDIEERNEILKNNNIKWTKTMNIELIQFAQNLAAIYSYSPEIMTPGDLLTLMKKTEDNGNNEEEDNICILLPDNIQYPSISSLSYHQLLYQFSLITLFNQGMSDLLLKLDMDLVEEWWSLSYEIQQLCSAIFTATKINYVRVHKPDNLRYRYPFKVTLNRRLAQDSNLTKDSSFSQLYRQIYNRMDILVHRAYYQSQPFEVSLLHEGAIDQGGPYRDCLMQIVSDTQGNKSIMKLFIEPDSSIIDNQDIFIPNIEKNQEQHLNQYKFIGQLLGMCIRTGDSIPFYLAPIVWKWLVNEELLQNDYEIIDSSIIRMIKYLNSSNEYYNELGSLLTFSIILDDDKIIDLKDNGNNILVTNENKNEYIQLLKQYYLNQIQLQLNAIKEGFSKIVPKGVIPLFTSIELQERIAGKKDIDIEYLKQHTVYGISEDLPVIKYFWDTLRSFTNQQRSMFLRFVWGRSTLPPSPEEFTEQFCITELPSTTITNDLNEDEKLPHAHTCAFQIELPNYSSEKILKEKLLYAITNCRDIDLEWQTPNPS